jgi:hypothetical protein
MDNGRSSDLGSESALAQLGALVPGDAVEFFGGGEHVVRTTFLCEETVDDQAYHWRWMFLDDGSLIEVSPDGYYWYQQHQIVKQGTSLYEELVAQDGALVRFEERVRAGESGRRPVHVTLEGKEYRLTGTGTTRVQRLGAEPALLPWRSFDPKADENVYFGLVQTADESQVVLGLWTAHVCLSSGHELGETDVVGVYRRKG